MSFRIVVDNASESLQAAILRMDLPVKRACTKSIIAAGTSLFEKGKSDIAAGVRGNKFPAGWNVRYYQTEPPQVDAAAWAYHKIPWADVFESGATIAGKPLLWIPLRNAPSYFGGGKITPKKLEKKNVRLFPIKRSGKPPLLATKVFVTRGQAKKTVFKISAKKILSGRTTPIKNADKMVRITVPLFFGIAAVTIRKKFHLGLIADSERAKLPAYYDANLEVDN